MGGCCLFAIIISGEKSNSVTSCPNSTSFVIDRFRLAITIIRMSFSHSRGPV